MRCHDSLPTSLRTRLQRTSFDGRPVTLLEGPAWLVGSVSAAALSGDLTGVGCAVGTGTIGLVDDLVGDTATKGVRGHLAALRRGRVTSGGAKIAVIVGTAGWAAARESGAGERGTVAAVTQGVVDAGVIAGAANVVNLFDLRPGRALKVVLLAGLPLLLGRSGRPTMAGVLGATVGVLRSDLAGRSMLGDAGANAAGAMLGLSAVRGLTPAARRGALAVLVALTLASERVSFTQVIERTPSLRALDRLGRPSPDQDRT